MQNFSGLKFGPEVTVEDCKRQMYDKIKTMSPSNARFVALPVAIADILLGILEQVELVTNKMCDMGSLLLDGIKGDGKCFSRVTKSSLKTLIGKIDEVVIEFFKSVGFIYFSPIKTMYQFGIIMMDPKTAEPY